MAATWFALVAFMLVMYVVLDGFDFGAGIAHLFVARDDAERRAVFAAIGPVWDCNEVWLIAAGGVLFFAFPRVYAAAFSGFYLPLMFVLWLLILRGVAIEVRSQQANVLWRAFWDAVFAGASGALAFVLGVAFGNVVRGLPLERSGYFRAPLFTNLLTGPRPGALDWYTVLVGAFAVALLGAHGATYLAWKTSGPVHDAARRLASRLWWLVAAALVATTVATFHVRPALLDRLVSRPWIVPLPVLALGALAWVQLALRRGRELGAFLGSCGVVAGLLVAAAALVFPWMLPSTLSEDLSLTAYNSTHSAHGLRVGLAWWIPALALAVGYTAFLFRSARGKVVVGAADTGH